MPAKKLPSTPTPRELGYRMPAEWEAHAATWIAWPHNRTDWPGKFAAIPWVYADIIRHLSPVEKVNIIVSDAEEKRSASEILDRSNIDLSRIEFHPWPTNRVWTRDSGPIFLKRDTKEAPLALTQWRFNAWAKYADWKHDTQLPARVAKKLKIPQFTPVAMRDHKPYHVVLEGGSIDVNGRGLMLTTEECLLSTTQQRNPGLSQRDLERIFADYLNVEKVIWLGQGIAGDDTHGHVDDIARFVSPDTVLAVSESSRDDSNYEPLQENLHRLRSATDLAGRKLQVIELPLPSPFVFRKQRLPASYANFYIANNLVLVPTFNDRNDRVALNVIAGVFPKHEVVGIHCGDFIWGLGAIHCMTQQQPAIG